MAKPKTKDDLLQELKQVAPEVFDNINPEEVIKADIEKLIAKASSENQQSAISNQQPTDPKTQQSAISNQQSDDATADDINDANGSGDTLAPITDQHFKKWGVAPDHRELVSLVMAGYELTPDDVFVVKVINPTECKIITVDGRKCESIDYRMPG